MFRNGILLLLMYFLFAFSIADEIKVYFSAENKEGNIFWRFDVSGNFPKSEGIIHVQLFFGSEELPSSRQRLIMTKGSFFYIYNAGRGQALSGEYTLKVKYSYQSIRTDSQHIFSIGSLYNENKEKSHYKHFFEEFVIAIELALENLNTSSNSNLAEKKHIQQTLIKLSNNLDSLSFPHVLYPHYGDAVWSCRTILRKINQAISRRQLSPEEVAHIKNYLAIVKKVFIVKVEEDQLEQDIQIIATFINSIEPLLVKSLLQSNKNWNEMITYLLEEIKVINNKVILYLEIPAYKNDPVCTSSLLAIPNDLNILLSISISTICKENNLSFPKEIKKNNKNPIIVKENLNANIQKILQQLQQKKDEAIGKVLTLKKQLIAEYYEIKEAVYSLEAKLGLEKTMLKFKAKVKHCDDDEFTTTINQAFYYLEMIQKTKHKDDELNQLYLSKYKMSLVILEKKFTLDK